MKIRAFWISVISFFIVWLFIGFTPPTIQAAFIEFNARNNYMSFISGEEVIINPTQVASTSAEAIARAYLGQYGAQFGITNQQKELIHVGTSSSENPARTIQLGTFSLTPIPTIASPMQHVKFQQVYQAIPVFAAEVLVHLQGNTIHAVTAELSPDIVLDPKPIVSENSAMEEAKTVWQRKGLTPVQTNSLGLFILNPSLVVDGENSNYLVWQIELRDSVDHATNRELLFIDAKNKNLRLTLPGIFDARNRQTYNCGGNSCSLTLSENQQTSGNADVDTTHQSMGTTYDYYFNIHHRDSISGGGSSIRSYANWSCQKPNAWWDGSTLNFCRRTTALDVDAHEFTHGVTQYTAGLSGRFQSGALNEAISDIFASNIDANWTIGENATAFGGAIRDMADPPRHNQPDRLFSERYACQSEEVHKNNGPINKAAFLLTDGGTFNGCTVTGIGREKARTIEYLMLTKYLNAAANFRSFYNAMNSACEELYGKAGSECIQTDNAMKAVEIDQQPLGSQRGARCTGQTRIAPTCSSTTPLPTATISPSATTGPSPTGPTPTQGTPQPTPSPRPTTSSTAEIAIWNSIQSQSDVKLASASKLQIGTPVSICYNRAAGPFSLTIDRGGNLTSTYHATFSSPRQGGCLHYGDQQFFPLGLLASPEGSIHTYTIESGGKTVSTTLLVTTGGR